MNGGKDARACEDAQPRAVVFSESGCYGSVINTQRSDNAYEAKPKCGGAAVDMHSVLGGSAILSWSASSAAMCPLTLPELSFTGLSEP